MFVFIILLSGSIHGQERLIKPGDAIKIVTPQTEELSKIVVVDQNGTIDFPAIQSLPVDGITLERFKEILVAQLSRYLETPPLVMVQFISGRTNQERRSTSSAISIARGREDSRSPEEL